MDGKFIEIFACPQVCSTVKIIDSLRKCSVRLEIIFTQDFEALGFIGFFSFQC